MSLDIAGSSGLMSGAKPHKSRVAFLGIDLQAEYNLDTPGTRYNSMKWWIGMLRCLSMSFSGLPAQAMPMWNLRSGTFHAFDSGGRGMSMLGALMISSSVSPRAKGRETNVDHASASPGKFEGEGMKLIFR
jgi:hypothetical protein